VELVYTPVRGDGVKGSPKSIVYGPIAQGELIFIIYPFLPDKGKSYFLFSMIDGLILNFTTFMAFTPSITIKNYIKL